MDTIHDINDWTLETDKVHFIHSSPTKDERMKYKLGVTVYRCLRGRVLHLGTSQTTSSQPLMLPLPSLSYYELPDSACTAVQPFHYTPA